MLESTNVEINEMSFVLNPLRGFKALKLDKKIVSLLLPLIDGIESLDKEIDLGKALGGLSGALDNLPEADYEKFVGELLSTVQFLPAEEPPLEMSIAVIDKYFQGELMTVYQLMFKVMEFNKFTPFVLVSNGGKGTIKTLFSKSLTGATGR